MDNNLEKLHKIQVEILNEIVRICDKHNITYFLCGGTLLGAVRHKGFIPWDDDIDISMPREDYEKFRKICQTELNGDFFLQDWTTEPNHYLTFAKIKKHNTYYEEEHIKNLSIHKGVFVDIFILDYTKKQKSVFLSIQKFLHDKISSYLRLKILVKSYLKKTPRQKFGLFLAIPLSKKSMMNFLQWLMSINKNENSLYITSIASHYDVTRQTILKEKYFPPTTVEFEGKFYSAPNDSDYVLTKIHDDYMTLPPLDQRSPSHHIVITDDTLENADEKI